MVLLTFSEKKPNHLHIVNCEFFAVIAPGNTYNKADTCTGFTVAHDLFRIFILLEVVHCSYHSPTLAVVFIQT